MKFEGTRPSARDKDINVYMFVAGKEELQLIQDLIKGFLENSPRGVSFTQVRSRAKTIRKELETVLQEHV